MDISATQVNELRKKTGAGMMDCKKALTEANGDFEKAIEVLRKKGAAVATKRAEKTANEGMVFTKVSDDKKQAVILQINCETDFVAKSDDFISFTKSVIETIAAKEPENVEALVTNNPSVSNAINDILGKVGEKIEISRFKIEKAQDGLLVDYIHMGSKLGVLVKFENAPADNTELAAIGKDIAMQVAAMKPITTYREEVAKDVVEKEIDIYKELARKEGKPENMLEKIAAGRLNKFFQENCLLEQAFIKDNTKTVGSLIKDFNTKHNSRVKLSLFHRFHLGDEKK